MVNNIFQPKVEPNGPSRMPSMSVSDCSFNLLPYLFVNLLLLLQLTFASGSQADMLNDVRPLAISDDTSSLGHQDGKMSSHMQDSVQFLPLPSLLTNNSSPADPMNETEEFSSTNFDHEAHLAHLEASSSNESSEWPETNPDYPLGVEAENPPLAEDKNATTSTSRDQLSTDETQGRMDLDIPGARMAQNTEVERLVRNQVELAASNWATLAPADYLLSLSGLPSRPESFGADELRVGKQSERKGSAHWSQLHPNHNYRPAQEPGPELGMYSSNEASRQDPLTSTPSDASTWVSSLRPDRDQLTNYSYRMRGPITSSSTSGHQKEPIQSGSGRETEAKEPEHRTGTAGLESATGKEQKRWPETKSARVFERLNRLRGSSVQKEQLDKRRSDSLELGTPKGFQWERDFGGNSTNFNGSSSNFFPPETPEKPVDSGQLGQQSSVVMSFDQVGNISPQGFMDASPASFTNGPAHFQQVGETVSHYDDSPQSEQDSVSKMSTSSTATTPSLMSTLAKEVVPGAPNLRGSLAARLSANRFKNRKLASPQLASTVGSSVGSSSSTSRPPNEPIELANVDPDSAAGPLTINFFPAATTRPGPSGLPRPVLGGSSSRKEESSRALERAPSNANATAKASWGRPKSAGASMRAQTSALEPSMTTVFRAVLGGGSTTATPPRSTSGPQTSPATQATLQSRTMRPPARYHHLHSHIHNIKPALISFPLSLPLAAPPPPSSSELALGANYERLLAATAAAAAAAAAAATKHQHQQQHQQQQQQLQRSRPVAAQNHKRVASQSKQAGQSQRVDALSAARQSHQSPLGPIPIGGTLASASLLLPVGAGPQLGDRKAQGPARAAELQQQQRGATSSSSTPSSASQPGLLTSLLDSASRALKQVAKVGGASGAPAAHTPQSAGPSQWELLRLAEQQAHELGLGAWPGQQVGVAEKSPSAQWDHFQRAGGPSSLSLQQLGQLMGPSGWPPESGGAPTFGWPPTTTGGKTSGAPAGLELERLAPMGGHGALSAYLAGLLAVAAAAQEHQQQDELQGGDNNIGNNIGNNFGNNNNNFGNLAAHLSGSQLGQESEQVNSSLSGEHLWPLPAATSSQAAGGELASLVDDVVFASLPGAHQHANQLLYPILTSDKSSPTTSQLDQILAQLDNEHQPEPDQGHAHKGAGQPLVLNSIQDQGSAQVSSFEAPASSWPSKQSGGAHRPRRQRGGPKGPTNGERPVHHTGSLGAKLPGFRPAGQHFRHELGMPYALAHYIEQQNQWELGGQAELAAALAGKLHHSAPLRYSLPLEGEGPRSLSSLLGQQEAFRPLRVQARPASSPGGASNSSGDQGQASRWLDQQTRQPALDVINFDDSHPGQPPGRPQRPPPPLAPANETGGEKAPPNGWPGHEQAGSARQHQLHAAPAVGAQHLYTPAAAHTLHQLHPSHFVYVPAADLLHQALLHASPSVFRPRVVAAAAALDHLWPSAHQLLGRHKEPHQGGLLGPLELHSSLVDQTLHGHHDRSLQQHGASAAATIARLHRAAAVAAASNDLATSESARLVSTLGQLIGPTLRGELLAQYWPLALLFLPLMICVAILAQLVMAAPLAMFALTTVAAARLASSLFGPPPFSAMREKKSHPLGLVKRLEEAGRLSPNGNKTSTTRRPLSSTTPSLPNASQTVKKIIKFTLQSNDKLVAKLFEGLEANSTKIALKKKGPKS